jgi:hypothetical protein
MFFSRHIRWAGLAAVAATLALTAGPAFAAAGWTVVTIPLTGTNSSWSADTDPTAGTYSPLYGASTFPGASSEWAVGINSSDTGLVLSHG